MTDKDFSVAITVDAIPEEAFVAINNVRGWWSEEIEGTTDTLGGEFTFLVPDTHYTKFRITELDPGRRVVWHAVDAYLYFVEDKTEWTGTDVIFDITPKGAQTEIRFTHDGLVPAFQCYSLCSEAWSSYITRSLHDLITTGKGDPFRAGGSFETEQARHSNAVG